MLKHHTLEVPNAFLHSTKLDQPIYTGEYTPNKHHCLHNKKQPFIHIQIQIDWEGYFLCIDKITSKGPIVITIFDDTSRYQNLQVFKLNSQFHFVWSPLLPSM
jgi:hypothetical protein